MIKRVFRNIVKLLFANLSTQADCKFLSDSILANRKILGEIRERITSLESRVWKLEPHTIEESMAECARQIEQIESSMKKIQSN